jgi:hypothetical protein
MDPSSAKKDPVSIITCNKLNNNDKHSKEKNGTIVDTYLWSEHLTVISWTKEDWVAAVVHRVSGSNYTIYLQGPT